MDAIHVLGLGDLVRENRRRFPGGTALVDGDQRMTFGELDQRTSRLADALARRGVRSGDRIVWLAQNSFRCVEVLLAAARMGAIVCPLNWRLAPPEICFLLEDLDPSAVFWQWDILGDAGDSYRKSAPRAVWVEHATKSDEYADLLSSGDLVDQELPVDPNSAVLAIYTPMVDGQPAAALLSHTALLSQAVQHAYIYDLDSTDSFLSAGPMFHLGVFLFILPVMALGGKTVVAQKVDAEEMCQLIEAERCTRAFPLMQFTLQQIAEVNKDFRYDLSTLRVPNAVGVPDSMLSQDDSRGAYGTRWGQAETTGGVTWACIGSEPAGRFGRSTPLSLVRVVDDNGNEVTDGTVGELAVRGPTVANGYWNRPLLNKETFKNGWRLTRDLGRRESDGSITFIGPKARKIKSGVENIYPAEVEKALLDHAAVREVGVIGVPDEKWIQSVKAIVVSDPSIAVTQAELIDFCKTRVGSYKKPRYIEFVHELPRLNGALDYAALDARYGGGAYPGGNTRSW
jgi:acyl-CoA synthetase (AMP-forming)/AMP-acid ligase II